MAHVPAWKKETIFRKRVRLLRKENKLTQRDLIPFGVKQSYLANLETKGFDTPSREMVENIARGLGVTVDELVRGTDIESKIRASQPPVRAFCPNNLCPKLQLNRYATGMQIPYRFSIERRHVVQDKVIEAKFCPYCGKKMVSHCPKCNEAILIEDPLQTHCMHCGKPIFEKLTEEQVMAGVRG